MKSKKILIEIVELLEKFEMASSSDTEQNLDDFIDFLNHQRSLNMQEDTTIKISQNISLLHRYSKYYVKKALKSGSLQTMDEYTYLVTLFNRKSLSKTEINNLNVLEKTSGNEVMRRLLKAGFIAQTPDEVDRRKMQVYLTDKGRAELLTIFPELHKSAMLLSAPLKKQGKVQFSKTLEELCGFHKNIFCNRRDEETLDDLLNEFFLPVATQNE